MQDDCISIVLPTYKRPKILRRALKSILDQTYSKWECIVVDDDPKSSAKSVLDIYNDDRLRYVSHNTNRGVSAARNTGLEHSTYSLVSFLDDDDEWLPKKLELQAEKFTKVRSSVGLVYCWMEWVSSENVFKYTRTSLSGNIFDRTLDSQPLGNISTWLVSKDAALEVGGFDESLPRGNDGDFLRKITRQYEVDYVPQVLVRYHVDHGNKRITRSDVSGIRNAIKGQKVKLDKFSHELSKLPLQKSRIYARIAFRYGQLRDWRNCLKYFQRALWSHPLSLETYLYVARLFLSAVLNKHSE